MIFTRHTTNKISISRLETMRTSIRIDGSLIRSIVAGTIFSIYVDTVSAQITNATDCTNIPEFNNPSEINQTREELIALMDQEFVRKISEQESCEQMLNASGGGGVSGGGNLGAQTLTGGGATGGGESGVQTLTIAAPNQVLPDKSSLKLDENLSLLSDTNQGLVNSVQGGSIGQNGRKEMELVSADADAQTIQELKQAIAEEQDPEIKAGLQKMLQELEN